MHAQPLRCGGGSLRDRVSERGACNFDGALGQCYYGTCTEDLCAGVDCDDEDLCTQDECDLKTGTCYYYNAGFVGEPCTRDGLPGICLNYVCRTFNCGDVVCDDGDLCTDDWCHPEDDECGSSAKNCSDGNVCTDDTCDPETGECIHAPVPDGGYCCIDWSPNCGFCIPACPCCTRDGQCEGGLCVD